MFNDIKYMRFALELAQKAAIEGEVPIGAVIVDPVGNVLGVGYNLVEKESSSVEHAEMRAIRDAQRRLQDWRLEKCTMYVTLEPCLMCLGSILLARIERLVYASSSPIYGYTRILEGEDLLYGGFLKNVTPGVLADEASLLLDNFF
jgi:tRNA(adenine34) deaminase